MPDEARGFELPDGSEERSNEGWRFTDKWGDGIIKRYVLNSDEIFRNYPSIRIFAPRRTEKARIVTRGELPNRGEEKSEAVKTGVSRTSFGDGRIEK
ncbi:MAG: hypothetical protein LBM75_09135 [Myxococcales bacterium]|jgi:hypothetical protein|nr:hypothetical protein [Myxococcales bacterium]